MVIYIISFMNIIYNVNKIYQLKKILLKLRSLNIKFITNKFILSIMNNDKKLLYFYLSN